METTNYRNGILGASSVKSASDIESTQWTKYRAQRAHGWAGEDFNSLVDKLCGRDVDNVGLNNELNGADRIVNGVKIQTKYCQSAHDSVSNAFGSDGMYRYPGMKLEVPKGQAEDAIRYMEDRIRNGRVPGVSDPAQAKDIVVEGRCTYEQAVKIAKAGNLESIKFDVMNQAVTCACVAGLSFVLLYASSRLSGMSRDAAVRIAVRMAIRSGLTTMAAGVAVQQILRTQVGRNMAAKATFVARHGVDTVCRTEIGREVVKKMMTGVLGKSVTEASARNACIKLLRSNYFTSAAVMVAVSVPDMVKACKGKKSWKQVGKNAVVNVTGIGTGSAGWWAGAAAGSLACPGIGTVVGGLVGAIGGGVVGSAGAKKLMDRYADDDSKLCIRHIEDAISELCSEHDISEKELESIMGKMHKKNALNERFFEGMYKAGGKDHIDSAMKAYAKKTLAAFFPGEDQED